MPESDLEQHVTVRSIIVVRSADMVHRWRRCGLRRSIHDPKITDSNPAVATNGTLGITRLSLVLSRSGSLKRVMQNHVKQGLPERLAPIRRRVVAW